VRLFLELMSSFRQEEPPLLSRLLGPRAPSPVGPCQALRPLRARTGVTRSTRCPRGRSGVRRLRVAPVENSSRARSTSIPRLFLALRRSRPAARSSFGSSAPLGNMGPSARSSALCSPPSSLAQCRAWLSDHLADVEKISVASNAGSARRARERRRHGRRSPRPAAELYGPKILFSNVEDQADNTTRFWSSPQAVSAEAPATRRPLLVVGRGTEGPGVAHFFCFCYLFFFCFCISRPLARHGVNRTRIESRPSRRAKWALLCVLRKRGRPRTATPRPA